MSESGQALWKRAKHVIPGGNMLLSKRSEMHLPEGWPADHSRAKGCHVWDLDDNEYIDVGLMGVGTNILGYGHPVVDDEVRRVVDCGNLSTLNCPEEVYLAERLVDMHPWSDMVRLPRSGGEACSIAVRIGPPRAASRRWPSADTTDGTIGTSRRTSGRIPPWTDTSSRAWSPQVFLAAWPARHGRSCTTTSRPSAKYWLLATSERSSWRSNEVRSRRQASSKGSGALPTTMGRS